MVFALTQLIVASAWPAKTSGGRGGVQAVNSPNAIPAEANFKFIIPLYCRNSKQREQLLATRAV